MEPLSLANIHRKS